MSSKCMFCNSPSYGTGCPYSPHKKHVHVDDPRKCIYCGSTSLGQGCPYNPFSKYHVRGVEYNTMTRESLHHSVIAGLFLSRLTTPITETDAYKLGLVDSDGHKIRNCATEGEQAALTPLDMYIFKIRRLIGDDVVSLFRSNVLLEVASKKSSEQFDLKKYEDTIKLELQIKQVIGNIDSIFKEGIEKGISRSCIENLIIESIINLYDQQNHSN